jgi:hypothetical protein
VSEFLTAQSAALTSARSTIQAAQEKQAFYADQKRSDHTFQVGDHVFLNAEDITIPATRNLRSKKLMPKFVGPYTIAEQCSPVSFRLELPQTMRIHDVFHVDRFRHYHESPSSFGSRTPPRPGPTLIDGEEEYEVEAILDYQYYRRQHQFRVRWKGYTQDDDTWEPLHQLTHCSDILNDFIRKQGLQHDLTNALKTLQIFSFIMGRCNRTSLTTAHQPSMHHPRPCVQLHNNKPRPPSNDSLLPPNLN